MKKIKRIISSALCLLLCSALLLFGAACGTPERAAESGFAPLEEYEVINTTCVAENERYSLIWDADNPEAKRVVLYDKLMDREWSYIPKEDLNTNYDYESQYPEDAAVPQIRVRTPIIVKYYNTANFRTEETNAYAMSIREKTFTVKRIENGLEMTCYFLDRSITVPVRFTLDDNGVNVSVDPTKIQEDAAYNVYAIQVAPFFCSVSNDNVGKDDHYIFIPSGSGAIVNPVIDDTREAAIIFEEPVYGADENVTRFEEKTETESVRMPVYGAVNGDEAVCAIIKSGAENAYINGALAQKLTGYSYVASEFYIRGYQEVVQSLFTSTTVKTKLYSDAFTPDKIEVGFYPLYGEDASYVGMANTYRDYLNETNAFSYEKSDDTLLNLKLIGGIETKKFHFGIPSTAILSATTFPQAQTIIEDVKNRTGLDKFNVNLVGFGESGNDIGVVAGNYDFSSAFGSKDDLSKLIESSKANGADLYFNFDMIHFSESGGGVSTTFGKADSANGSYTALKYTSLNFRVPDNNLRTYYLVSRTKLSEVAAEIKESAADWGLTGISLDTLTSICYSDYNDKAYYSRANYDDQATAIINAYNNSGYKVAGSDANSFAAACCSHVYDAPTQTSKYRYYSAEVPFYQIVFKGSVSMSGTALNLSTNERTNFLKAVETGSGLTYTLISEYDTNLITSAQNVFYGSVYWDDVIERGVATSIEKTVKEYKELFDKVSNQKIIGHKIINKDVRLTTFENGVSVYVNYGDTEFTEGDIKVAACGYTVKEA